MNHRKVLSAIAAILSTIREVGSAPSGVAYAALMAQGYSLSDYQTILSAMKCDDLVVERCDVLTLTDRGADLARQVDACIGR